VHPANSRAKISGSTAAPTLRSTGLGSSPTAGGAKGVRVRQGRTRLALGGPAARRSRALE
jgi:hypothetical protein